MGNTSRRRKPRNQPDEQQREDRRPPVDDDERPRDPWDTDERENEIEFPDVEITEGFKVVLYRRPRGLSGWVFVGHYAPQDFSVERVAEDYGGGEYCYRLKDPRGRWASRDGKGRGSFIIDPTIYPPRSPAQLGDQLDRRNPPADEQRAAGVERILDRMEKRIDQAEALNRELILTLAKGNGGGSSLKEAIEIAKLISNNNGQKSTVGELREAFDLFREMNGEAPPEEEPDVQERLIRLAERWLDSEEKAKPATGATPAADNPPAAGDDGEMEAVEKYMLSLINSAIKAAELKKDPKATAEAFAAQIKKQGQAPLVTAIINDPSVMTLAEQKFPQIKNHREWFDRFLPAAREALK